MTAPRLGESCDRVEYVCICRKKPVGEASIAGGRRRLSPGRATIPDAVGGWQASERPVGTLATHVASYLQQKIIISYCISVLFVCIQCLWATPSSTSDACNKGHATRSVHWPCTKPHASCRPPPNQEIEILKHAAKQRHTRHTAVAQGTYQGTCLVHAHAQPASCNQQQNTTFINSHACSRGDDTRDTLQLHKACTKARASSMPVHNRCNEIKNKTQHLLAVTHAAEATIQETHCYCTRHVPRRMPSSMPMHNRL